MSKTAKIAVMVSGGGTNLQALINAQNKGIINSGKIELVISNNSNACFETFLYLFLELPKNLLFFPLNLIQAYLFLLIFNFLYYIKN